MNARARRSLLLVSAVVVAALPVLAQSQTAAPAKPPNSSNSKQTPADGKRRNQPPWWQDEAFKKSLNLTNDQAKQIEKVFQDTRPQLRTQMNDLDVLEDRLSKMIAKNQAEPQIIKQISEVELKRSTLNITRSVMLYQMRQVLKPQQRTNFDVLHEKWSDEVWGPYVQQMERERRQQRLKGEPKVGPEARPTPDPQKRPQ